MTDTERDEAIRVLQEKVHSLGTAVTLLTSIVEAIGLDRQVSRCKDETMCGRIIRRITGKV